MEIRMVTGKRTTKMDSVRVRSDMKAGKSSARVIGVATGKPWRLVRMEVHLVHSDRWPLWPTSMEVPEWRFMGAEWQGERVSQVPSGLSNVLVEL